MISFDKKLLYRINLVTEIAWWAIHLNPLARHAWMRDAINPHTRATCFPQRLMPYIENRRKKDGLARVIDVGSGPLTPLAWGVEQKLIDLVALDPLAAVYAFLLKLYRINFPVKSVPCYAEDLLEFCAPESIDIVYSRNALDHVRDAELCIGNICTILKTNGLFSFQGFAKEGSKQNWRGLHKHDFTIDEGDLIWSNQHGDVKNFSKAFGLKCLYQDKHAYSVGDWFVGEFQKT
jgi:SAM-dependent methyltransferase